jgi:thiamine pyrophosphokinase
MIKEIDDVKTVILADGVFPEHEIPLKVLGKSDLIVCCDGAVEKLVSHGFEPGVIAGDLDSLNEVLRERYKNILFQDSDQETNDLTKAVNWCISRGKTELIILGATGLREDHTLGNISLLAEYCKRAKVSMITDHGVFEAFTGPVTLGSWPGQQISIFSADSLSAVTSEGLLYPLNKLILSNWWRGTLNEAIGKEFTLDFSGGPLIVFRRFRY